MPRRTQPNADILREFAHFTEAELNTLYAPPEPVDDQGEETPPDVYGVVYNGQFREAPEDESPRGPVGRRRDVPWGPMPIQSAASAVPDLAAEALRGIVLPDDFFDSPMGTGESGPVPAGMRKVAAVVSAANETRQRMRQEQAATPTPTAYAHLLEEDD